MWGRKLFTNIAHRQGVIKISNANRDALGRWSSGKISAGTDPAPRGPAANIRLTSSDPSGLSDTPAAVVNESDAYGTLGVQSKKLLAGNRAQHVSVPTASGGKVPEPRDFSEDFAKLGYSPDSSDLIPKDDSGGQNSNPQALRAGGYSQGEHAGDHVVSAPGGRAGHGADVPGGGLPLPAQDDAPQQGGGAWSMPDASADAVGSAGAGPLAIGPGAAGPLAISAGAGAGADLALGALA